MIKSMIRKVLGLVAVSILLSSVLVMAVNSGHLAEAKTAKESPKHKYNKWYKHICNDQVCKGKTPLLTVKRIGNSGPNNN